MDVFFQQVINGLVMGSMYALVALGYTMVYGIINLINFAHGEVLMVGISVARIRMTHPGAPGMASRIMPMADQLVRAPTISTSPCAKLIRLMMPYTMV